MALEYLHSNEQQNGNTSKPLCIHRDVKAANILLTDSGRAKLIDFGISFNIAGKANSCSSCVFVRFGDFRTV